MDKEYGSVIVSWDFSNGDDANILIVGRQSIKGQIDIISAFQGEEAIDIYNMLCMKKGDENG